MSLNVAFCLSGLKALKCGLVNMHRLKDKVIVYLVVGYVYNYYTTLN